MISFPYALSMPPRALRDCAFSAEAEASQIVVGLKWIFSAEPPRVRVRGANLLDTLCARLEMLMQNKPGEQDSVMLQHKFVVEWADKREVCYASSSSSSPSSSSFF